jgi:hypothetical protein
MPKEKGFIKIPRISIKNKNKPNKIEKSFLITKEENRSVEIKYRKLVIQHLVLKKNTTL